VRAEWEGIGKKRRVGRRLGGEDGLSTGGVDGVSSSPGVGMSGSGKSSYSLPVLEPLVSCAVPCLYKDRRREVKSLKSTVKEREGRRREGCLCRDVLGAVGIGANVHGGVRFVDVAGVGPSAAVSDAVPDVVLDVGAAIWPPFDLL
jgi:hypothetical protein